MLLFDIARTVSLLLSELLYHVMTGRQERLLLRFELMLPANCFNISPELTEVLSEDFQGSLQEVLDGISLLHLQEEQIQR